MSTWHEGLGLTMPDLSIREPFSVLDFDEHYNRKLATLLIHNSRQIDSLPDRFYIDTTGKIRSQSGNLISINMNPHREAYKLSALYNLTQEHLETYIENNITDLPAAKDFLKKLSAVVLYLVKQTKLDRIDAEPATESMSMETLGNQSNGIVGALKSVLKRIGL